LTSKHSSSASSPFPASASTLNRPSLPAVSPAPGGSLSLFTTAIQEPSARPSHPSCSSIAVEPWPNPLEIPASSPDSAAPASALGANLKAPPTRQVTGHSFSSVRDPSRPALRKSSTPSRSTTMDLPSPTTHPSTSMTTGTFDPARLRHRYRHAPAIADRPGPRRTLVAENWLSPKRVSPVLSVQWDRGDLASIKLNADN
jgi:hypothetical protein